MSSMQEVYNTWVGSSLGCMKLEAHIYLDTGRRYIVQFMKSRWKIREVDDHRKGTHITRLYYNKLNHGESVTRRNRSEVTFRGEKLRSRKYVIKRASSILVETHAKRRGSTVWGRRDATDRRSKCPRSKPGGT